MIALLGQSDDDILYFVKRFRGLGSTETLPGGIKVYFGKFAGEMILIAATGYGNMQSSMVTAAIIDKYDPYLVVSIGKSYSINKNVRQGDLVIVDRYYLLGIRYAPLMMIPYGQLPDHPAFFKSSSEENDAALNVALRLNNIDVTRGYLLSGDSVYTESSQIDPYIKKHYAAISQMMMAYDTSSGGIALACESRDVYLLSLRIIAGELNNPEHIINFRRKSLEKTPLVSDIFVQLLMKKSQIAPRKSLEEKERPS